MDKNNNMSFYHDIVSAYDEIFPLNQQQVCFIEQMFSQLGGKKMLDAGCGTGSLAIALGRRSASVRAFDLDVDMVNRALEKCPQAIDAKFLQGDLLKMDGLFPQKTFDIVYCFGNTLAHLPSLKDVEQFVLSSSQLLKDAGKLLVQIVNYDRVMESRVGSLPTIESDHYIFERLYGYRDDNAIDFTTNLMAKSDNSVCRQSVRLIPLLKYEIERILEKYFSQVSFYSSFDKAMWSTDSFHTIIEASI